MEKINNNFENLNTENKDLNFNEQKEIYRKKLEEAGSYNKLNNEDKLPYRIYIMGESKERAELELKLESIGGFDKLSTYEQKQLEELRKINENFNSKKEDILKISKENLEELKKEKYNEYRKKSKEAGGYDKLSTEDKLPYRIYVMGESKERAELELKLYSVGGFNKLSTYEQKILNELRISDSEKKRLEEKRFE